MSQFRATPKLFAQAFVVIAGIVPAGTTLVRQSLVPPALDGLPATVSRPPATVSRPVELQHVLEDLGLSAEEQARIYSAL